MKNDEFNIEKIINEGNNPNFEFGSTQDAEFTSYNDNSNTIRDEVNDNKQVNDDHKPEEEKKEDKNEDSQESKQNSSNNSSNGNGGSSPKPTTLTTTVANVSVVGAVSLVAVTAVSSIVGLDILNQKPQAKINYEKLVATDIEVIYYLNLTDAGDDEFVLLLEGEEFSAVNILQEGGNEGNFEDLTPQTTYTLSVINKSDNDFVVDVRTITTLEPTTEYLVEFDTDGGSEIESQYVRFGSKASKPNIPIKEGFIFDGWFKDRDLMYPFSFNTPIIEDIIIYGSWRQGDVIPDYVSLFFETDGGSDVQSQRVIYGDFGEEVEDPTKLDQEFAGWYLEDDLVREFDFGILLFDNTTVYAKWNEPTPADAVTVTLDANGGSGTMDPVVLEKGSKYPLPTNDFIPPSGYMDRGGWHYKSSTGTYYPSGIEITVNSDITLYAAWTEDTRPRVSFDANGGSGEMDPVPVSNYDYTAPESDFEAPLHYKFDHWTVEGDSWPYYPGDAMTITQDQTLFANYIPDVELSVHINYLDTKKEGASYIGMIDYTYVDTYEMYDEVSLRFYGSGIDETDIGVSFESGEGTQHAEIDLNNFHYVDNNNVFRYHVIAHCSEDDKEYTLCEGSFSVKYTQTDYFYEAQINNSPVSDDGLYDFFVISGKTYIPLKLDLVDDHQTTFGQNLVVRYAFSDNPSNLITTYITNRAGTQFVLIENAPEEEFTLSSLSIETDTQITLATYRNISLALASQENYGICGFEIDYASFVDDYSFGYITLYGMGYDSSLVSGFHGMEYQLSIKFLTSDYDDYVRRVDISFEPDDSAVIGEQFAITEVTEWETISKYAKDYVASIELSYYDSTVQSFKSYGSLYGIDFMRYVNE